jgi:hypothetical protein
MITKNTNVFKPVKTRFNNIRMNNAPKNANEGERNIEVSV